ncbi:alpha/beta hydrolase family protein [Salinispora arenicola]|uniref:alpha/beta hydrolase family protein n=1 Tax=Salinispora arenicola TaxID=168697 RepID=UPI000399DC1B|nr:chlorophyllase [Salinispora arenicola]
MNPALGTRPVVPVLSVAPVTIPAPGRVVDLELRVSAPVTGSSQPVVLLSHNHGPSNLSSWRGYGPLVEVLAACGFVVVQPTHLDSKVLGLREANVAEAPLYWRSRATDLSYVIDNLDTIEAAMPTLDKRIDRKRIAAVGHSAGGHTVSLLLGRRLNDPEDGSVVDLSDTRVRAGVILSGLGRGGDALSEYARENYPFLQTSDFSTMTTPALVVAGDQEAERTNVVGASWPEDPYTLSPAPKALLTVFGGEHSLGGIVGYGAAETTDEDRDRVAAVGAIVGAYLLTTLGVDDRAWEMAKGELESSPEPQGRVVDK